MVPIPIQRLLFIISGLLGLAGIYRIPEDMNDLLRDSWGAIASDPVSASLIAIAIVLALVAGSGEIRKWIGFPSERQLANTIADWLHHRGGFALKETRIESDVFTIIAEGLETRFLIQVSKAKKDKVIMLQVGLTIGKDHKAALDGGPEAHRRELYDELVIELTKLGVQVKITSDDYHISKINLWDVMPVESLLPYPFLETVGKVIRAEACVNQLIARRARLAREATAAEVAARN